MCRHRKKNKTTTCKRNLPISEPPAIIPEELLQDSYTPKPRVSENNTNHIRENMAVFNGGNKGFKLENATIEDADEIAEM